MKRTLLGVLLCATALGLSAQDNSKEIVKKGWNFGPLPVVGWDSDLGFQYGACVSTTATAPTIPPTTTR